MKNPIYDPDALIKIHVESTTNIKKWAPVLVEMLKKDCGIYRSLFSCQIK